VPFETLVETLAPARSLAHQPLFQVMLAVQNNPPPVLDLPGLQTSGLQTGGLPAEDRTARFDLEISLGETFDAQGTPAGLRGVVIAAADLFDAQTAWNFSRWFEQVLTRVAAEPQTQLHRVRIGGQAERPQVPPRPGDTNERSRP
jgi:non-ribosomal peptide synthetase component F